VTSDWPSIVTGTSITVAGLGPVRVLFPPFAHTPGLDRILCEVQVIIDANRVRSASVRRR
jgi:hypothetical protein